MIRQFQRAVTKMKKGLWDRRVEQETSLEETLGREPNDEKHLVQRSEADQAWEGPGVQRKTGCNGVREGKW